MDKRILQKVNAKLDAFKQQLLNDVSNKSSEEIYKHIQDLNLTLELSDLIKRKRINNSVPPDMKCIAKAANNKQCSRRKKDGETCCGTHCKGVPHGYINADSIKTYQKEVVREEINGILQYIDSDGNVYKMEDVLKKSVNPEIVAKWTKVDGQFIIHSL
jgi:hypothetical protein